MNNKFVYFIGVIIVIAGVYSLVSQDENISNPLEKKEVSTKKPYKTNIKNNINLTKEEKIKNKQVVTIVNNKNYKNIDKNIQEIKRNNIKTYITTSKKIENFIENNNLNSIQKIGNIEIYAKNFPQKNEFTPPMPPTLIKVKFKNKAEIVPLNSNLIRANKKIYVIQKKDDKFANIKEIDTKKLISFTPPAIGQN